MEDDLDPVSEDDALDLPDDDAEDPAAEDPAAEDEDDGEPGGAGATRDSVEDRPRGRASDTIRSLRQSRQQAEREAREAREEADRLRQQLTAPRQPTAAEIAAEQERIALMSPEERMGYQLTQTQQHFNNQLQRLQFQQADHADRLEFQQLCRDMPAIAKLKDKVEAALAKERTAGRPGAPRHLIAKLLLGESVLERASRATGTQRAKGAAARERETTRPGVGRSDVIPQRGRTGGNEAAARAKRLENVKI